METSSSEPKETGNSDIPVLDEVCDLLKIMAASDKASSAYGNAEDKLNVITDRYAKTHGAKGVGELVNEALVLNRMEAE